MSLYEQAVGSMPIRSS